MSGNRRAGSPGEQREIEVTGAATGAVWGTDTYTTDSDIATAAVHARLLQIGERGRLRVTYINGQATYAGTPRNGVTSFSWAQFPTCYLIERIDQP